MGEKLTITRKDGYQRLGDELIETIEKRNRGPVIGIGHSAGALTTLFAAQKRPDLFLDTILIDPVLMHPTKRWAYAAISKLGLEDRLSPSGSAERRKQFFRSKAEARSHWQHKPLYRTLEPAAFDAFIDAALVLEEQNALRLRIRPEREAELYRAVIGTVGATFDRVFGYGIFPKQSQFMSALDRSWWRQSMPNFEIYCPDGGHLWPLENTTVAANAINHRIALITDH